MHLKQGLAVVAAALAVFALPASNVFAGDAEDGKTIELHYCDGGVGQAGSCATAIVPATDWAQADGAINACFGRFAPNWTADEVESCILSSGYQAGPRTVVEAGVIHSAGSSSEG
ncbi:MAG TPA: hypothetical protein VMS60_06180 [Solirubrobacterales bacterium]|nr:hypothetical protein [Solirubrobacterales bacterium]